MTPLGLPFPPGGGGSKEQILLSMTVLLSARIFEHRVSSSVGHRGSKSNRSFPFVSRYRMHRIRSYRTIQQIEIPWTNAERQLSIWHVPGAFIPMLLLKLKHAPVAQAALLRPIFQIKKQRL